MAVRRENFSLAKSSLVCRCNYEAGRTRYYVAKAVCWTAITFQEAKKIGRTEISPLGNVSMFRSF